MWSGGEGDVHIAKGNEDIPASDRGSEPLNGF